MVGEQADAILMRPRCVTPSVSFALSVRQPSAFDLGLRIARRLHADSRCTLPLLVEMDSAWVVVEVNFTLVNEVSKLSIRRTQLRLFSVSKLATSKSKSPLPQ
jgi:hypothetical protein